MTNRSVQSLEELLATGEMGDVTRDRLRLALRDARLEQEEHERLVDKFAVHVEQAEKLNGIFDTCMKALKQSYRLPQPSDVVDQLTSRQEVREALDKAVYERDEAVARSRDPWQPHFRESYDKLHAEKVKIEKDYLNLVLRDNAKRYALEDCLKLLRKLDDHLGDTGGCDDEMDRMLTDMRALLKNYND